MMVECPSCGVMGEITNELATRLRCSKCDTVFDLIVEPAADITARIWHVKGERVPPVSLRVLKYRVKSGALSKDQEISGDGKIWLKADSHPLLKAVFEEEGENRIQNVSPGSDVARDGSADQSRKKPETTALWNPRKSFSIKRRRWKTRLGIASFAILVSAVFFFPLNKSVEYLRLENSRLKAEKVRLDGLLSEADGKIAKLEGNISAINAEFERVKSSDEEFQRAKEILEDIKNSIDSHKLYLVVSLAEDRLYVKIGTKTLKSYSVSTGKGATVLKGTGKTYNFLTPRGRRIIKMKEKNPVWLKPDWVWLEQGIDLPDSISIEDKAVEGELGWYRLQLGDGYAIHGTRSGKVNGYKETHGCIRMKREELGELFAMVKRGTEVYIY